MYRYFDVSTELIDFRSAHYSFVFPKMVARVSRYRIVHRTAVPFNNVSHLRNIIVVANTAGSNRSTSWSGFGTVPWGASAGLYEWMELKAEEKEIQREEDVYRLYRSDNKFRENSFFRGSVL